MPLFPWVSQEYGAKNPRNVFTCIFCEPSIALGLIETFIVRSSYYLPQFFFLQPFSTASPFSTPHHLFNLCNNLFDIWTVPETFTKSLKNERLWSICRKFDMHLSTSTVWMNPFIVDKSELIIACLLVKYFLVLYYISPFNWNGLYANALESIIYFYIQFSWFYTNFTTLRHQKWY